MSELNEVFDANIFKRAQIFNILSTNARSITPKIDSFIEYLCELDTSLAFLSETWLCLILLN